MIAAWPSGDRRGHGGSTSVREGEAAGETVQADRWLPVVRRTTVALGPFRYVREEFGRGDAAAAPPAGPARPGATNRLALAALICASVGGIAVAATRGPLSNDYVVRLPVPTSASTIAVKREVPPPARKPKRALSAAPTRDHGADDIVLDLSGPSLPTRLTAIDTALRTGEMQEWRDAAGPAHGYVVAGPASDEGTLACRDLSILTRAPGAIDHVDQRRECRARTGG